MQATRSSTGRYEMPSRTTWYILMPTFAVSGLLLIVGVGGGWYIHQANRQVSDALDEHVAAAQAAGRLVLDIRDIRLTLNHLIETGDESHLLDAQASLAKIAESPLADDFPELASAANELRERLRQLDVDPADEAHRVAARESISQLGAQLLRPAEQLLNERQLAARDTSLANQAIADRIGLGLLLLGVCGSVAGLLIGFGMARGVHRSLVEISMPVRDIAGRLNEVVGPIKVSSDTNLAELDGALRMLADKTADVVRRLQASQQETLRHEQLAAVGQLAAGLAHELRNPLMSVKLIVQTAAERTDSPLGPRDLAVIEDEVTRLEKMLQTFLDFARPPEPEKQTVDARELVEQTIEFLRPRAEQQDVQLRFSAPEEGIFVNIDTAQIRQVLLNLLLNALDAMPDGGNVKVEITPTQANVGSYDERHDAASPKRANRVGIQEGKVQHSSVDIRVTDDGPGVPLEVIDRIFEPFVSTKLTGIGLGLSISRRIVEAHDGQITVRNRDRGGAEFTVALPAARSVLPPTATATASHTHSRDRTGLLQK